MGENYALRSRMWQLALFRQQCKCGCKRKQNEFSFPCMDKGLVALNSAPPYHTYKTWVRDVAKGTGRILRRPNKSFYTPTITTTCFEWDKFCQPCASKRKNVRFE